ncbi:ABC transporter permease [Phytohabitans kaempferiae]|uniref:ABC transporter permease n=1 Tax=Phytohabitans kaempferiae TaxID=1620943 RepID=A0ABV6LZ38_9ACTN
MAAAKVLLLVPVLLLVSVGTFALLQLGPGDPVVAVLGETGTAEDYERVREQMGLDEPPVQRYLDWLGGVVRGDLGQNLVPPIEDVSDRLMRAFPVNLELAFLAIVMALVLAVPLAMWSAYRPGGRADRWIAAGTVGIISVPSFLLGLVLLLAFAINVRVFPLGQWARPTEAGLGENLLHAFLPALTLALAEAPVFARLLRGDLIATLREDFILAARAKGMPSWHIMLREALRPSSFSLVTLAGVSVGRLLGGTILVEAVFTLPGVGSVIINAAQNNDYKLVQGGVLLIAAVYLLLNLAVDVLYGFLDPRVRRRHV